MRHARITLAAFLAGIVCASLAYAAASEPQLQLTEDHSVGLESFLAQGGRCGVPEVAPETVPFPSGKGRFETIEGTITIPIAFHIIYKDTYKNGKLVHLGDVTTKQIDKQIAVLNMAYASAGVVFTKRSVDKKQSTTWYGMTMGSPEERLAKAALAIDPAHVLNIYTAAIGNDLLGWAYFPWSYPEGSSMHGVVLLYSSLPGGTAKPYNLGNSATHEIGHYLGLLHTFQNGCRAPGDFVGDTPDEATPAYGCPGTRNTCLSPGNDPTTNYMDYVDDACMTTFTAGQITRMHWATQAYRPSLSSAALAMGGTAPAETPSIHLLAASPNPFNPTTRIAFQLTQPARVTLDIYDIAGRRAAQLLDQELSTGSHAAIFEGRGLASGVYMAVLRAGRTTLEQRLVLLK